MFYYAVLNENDICTGVSQLSGEVNFPNNITIDSLEKDVVWKKYDRVSKTWSTEKFEPISTAPINEFEQLKQRQDLMQQALDDFILSGGSF